MIKQMLTRTLALCIISILAINQFAYTQSPDTLWTKILGFEGNEYFTSNGHTLCEMEAIKTTSIL